MPPAPTIRICLPHACGGVSTAIIEVFSVPESSPRLWGCFLTKGIRLSSWVVFPTPVGVFPSLAALRGLCLGLPHACGGVSNALAKIPVRIESSPRLWGCFHITTNAKSLDVVFPTPVGVFPGKRPSINKEGSLPHACGGVSSKGFT